MNKKWKGAKKSVKSSPDLFEDEEKGTTSTDEVRAKSCVTPHSKKLSDHSTPNEKVAIDSPEFRYNESPIVEPLTQHPPSEVGWDCRQVLKDDQGGSCHMPMDTCTPKRSTNHLLTKKRNSNSPLLYKPVKKKLMQDQQRESMEDLMKDLKNIETSAKQKKDNEITKKTDSSAESQIVIDMEVVSDDSDMKLQVSENTNESPGQAKNEVVPVKNHNALLDDSIDDMMVLCSQEVEAKEFGIKTNKTHNAPPLYTIRENSSETSHNSSSENPFKNPAKENVQPANSAEKVMNVSDVSSRNSSKSNKSESFPDDSFDDMFIAIDDKDLCQNNEIVLSNNTKSIKTHKPPAPKVEDRVNKSSEPQKKFFQSKGSNYVESKSIRTTSGSYAKNPQNEKVFIQSKVVNEKASYGYLNKDYMKSNNSSFFNSGAQNTTANGARLFKAKSFSDSNFLQQNNPHQNLDRSHSSLNINYSNYQKQQQSSEGYGSAPPTDKKGWRRTNSSTSFGISQYSVNRLTNSEGSQSTSTPAEIERKRQEALARRQKKMVNNAQKRPMQQPQKR